jgi:hypothetical protein
MILLSVILETILCFSAIADIRDVNIFAVSRIEWILGNFTIENPNLGDKNTFSAISYSMLNC